MPIEVTCPECQSLLRIADENAGRQARCPSCSAVFTAQAPAATSGSPAPTTVDSGLGTDTRGMPGGVDPKNPYAPTVSEPARDYAPSDWSPRTITPEEVLSKAWAIFKDQWVMASVALLIVGGINFGLSMLEQVIVQGLNAAAADRMVIIASQFVVGFLRWLLQMWLQIGQTLVMLDIARGRGVNLSKIFSGAPYLVNTVIAVIIIGLIVFSIFAVLAGIPAGVAYLATQDQNAAAMAGVIGVLVAITPIVVISLMFSQVQLLIIDRNADALNSLQTSRQITGGNKMTIFLTGIMVAVIGVGAFIVGLLLLCVGVIPAMIGFSAYASLVMVVMYLCMTGQAVATPQRPASPGQAGIAGS